MTITAAEQYGIELLNRARLDPQAEARRYGLGLNEGLAGGTISGGQKQALAPNDALGLSSQRHSDWMLSTDTFSHTGVNGTNPDARMKAAGFSFTGNWSWGENLAYVGFPGGKGAAWAIAVEHRNLMDSPGHRENIMRDSFREIGYSQETGSFQGGTGSMLTQNYASRGTHVFVTGVAYADRDGDNFYSIGEGRGGITFSQAGTGRDTTADAGGYGLRVTPGGQVEIRISAASDIATVIVDTRDSFRADPNNGDVNVKLDLIDRDTVAASSDLTLVSGAPNARLLGINGFSLTGSDAANRLVGNAGGNRISGMDGNDALLGQKGRDVLSGNAGDDRLTGGAGADRFIFAEGGGDDHVTDFRGRAGDRLLLDHDLWGGGMSKAEVVSRFAEVVHGDLVLDFGNGQTLTLDDWSFKSKLAACIEII